MLQTCQFIPIVQIYVKLSQTFLITEGEVEPVSLALGSIPPTHTALVFQKR